MVFRSKKVKSDSYLLLLPPVTIFIRGKVKIVQVYKVNKSYFYHLLKVNTNLGKKLKISINSGLLYYGFNK